jgi:hypothetical protein
MATNGPQNIQTAASGQVLQGAGVGVAPAFSTATYPATATGTGKILRADGTNWVATTATFPDTAGSSGNVLQSNGTNWSSAAPSSSAGLTACLATATGNPLDSTTYYLETGAFDIRTATGFPQGTFRVPFACTITKAVGIFSVAGTLGSNQNCTLFLRKNDTTNTNISTTIQLTSATVAVSNTGLSLSLVAGDYLKWGFTGPVWTTNPTTVSFSGTFST